MALTSPRDSFVDPPSAPEVDFSDQTRALRQIYELLLSVLDGYIPSTVDVTLRENQATTSLAFDKIHPGSAIILVPLTANAQAITMPYASALARGSCTLNHANNANADKTFRAVVLGI